MKLIAAITYARRFIAGEKFPIDTPGTRYLSSKEGRALVRKFTFPVASRYVELLVRKTLHLTEGERLTSSHLQIGVVSALLFPLRQVIGSCFATAPAIYIQREKPERLLLDLCDLFLTGKMRRVVEGEEYTVPISPKGSRQGEDHPLLRIWEYTIASFSDYKTTFSRWNLCKSLGLDPQNRGGIGAFVYKFLQEKLECLNQKVDHLQEDYLRAVDEARLSQALLRQAASPERIDLRKMEVEMRVYHAEVSREMRDKEGEYAHHLAHFFSFLIEQYTGKFQEHFIEIFDAEVHGTREELYEDSPAGFSLVYKHGRSDPSAWTYIQNREEFFTVLHQFFTAVEPQIAAVCAWERGKKELEEMTTALLHFISTSPFQQFALRGKKPWSYSSGGSLQTLLKGYFSIEGAIEEEAREIESPADLLTFLLDLLKGLPPSTTQKLEQDSQKSLFMYSPTHAFLLQPGLSPFKQGWLDAGFTYTWIRDTVIHPAKKHYQSVQINRAEQSLLAAEILERKIPPSNSSLSLPEFYAFLLKEAPEKRDAIDNFLFQKFSKHAPLLFGDTNWLDYSFAFAVNPATLELDLYRVSQDRKRIYPMHPWRSYLDGTRRGVWGVLTRPSDYEKTPFSDLSLKLRKV